MSSPTASVLSREQIRAVDRRAVQQYGMPGILLMENAGRNAAAILLRDYGPEAAAEIFCGTGNNGGDGCVIARHLHNAGWAVRLLLAGEEARLSDDARVNFGIVRAMGLKPVVAAHADAHRAFLDACRPDALFVDALLGTGFRGAVRSPLAELIERFNAAPKRAAVAIDVPSGLDCDTGEAAASTVRADLTITFVAVKRGMTTKSAAPFVGRIEVADIGVPRELIDGIAANPDATEPTPDP